MLDIGILSDDGVIKLDEKKRAFHYYQEGADIVAIRDLISYCMVQMEENDIYYKSFGGGAEILEDLDRHEQLALSQLGILSQFAHPSDLQAIVMKELPHRKILAAKRGDDAIATLRKSALDLISGYLDVRGEMCADPLQSGQPATPFAAHEPLTEGERLSRVEAVKARRAAQGERETKR